MSWKAIWQGIGLMLAGWVFSLVMNVGNFYLTGERVDQDEFWGDAISFSVLMLAVQFYHLRNAAIQIAKAVDETP